MKSDMVHHNKFEVSSPFLYFGEITLGTPTPSLEIPQTHLYGIPTDKLNAFLTIKGWMYILVAAGPHISQYPGLHQATYREAFSLEMDSHPGFYVGKDQVRGTRPGTQYPVASSDAAWMRANEVQNAGPNYGLPCVQREFGPTDRFHPESTSVSTKYSDAHNASPEVPARAPHAARILREDPNDNAS